MVKKVVLMLSGKAGSGKDTLAGFLGEDWERISFADVLKEKAAKKYNIPLDAFYDRATKDLVYPGLSYTPRDLLLKLGGAMRDKNPLCFVTPVIKKIQESSSGFFVLTDWRYLNELQEMRSAFSSLDLFDNTEVVTARVCGRGSLRSSHVTECALDQYDFDHTIHNKHSLEKLEKHAKTLAAMLGDVNAQGWVYGEVHPLALAICRKKIYHKGAACVQDAAQHLALFAMDLLPKKFNFKCLLTTFAYGVMSRELANYGRADRTRQKYVVLGCDETWLESRGDYIEKDFLLHKELLLLVNALPDDDKTLFSMLLNGESHKDIAESLGISESNSRRKLFNIRKILRVGAERLLKGE